MRNFHIGLRRIVLPEYAEPVLDVWNPNFRHIASFRGRVVTIGPEADFHVKNEDCPESAEAQYISGYHLETMSMIPLRLLALQGMHTTLSKSEVEGCMTGFDPVTKDVMEENGTATVIGTAQRFLTRNYRPAGTLVIPYCHSEASERYGGETIPQEERMLPSVTLRTNSDELKYALMSTKSYNQCHCDKVRTKMPFIPAAKANPEIAEINFRCMAEGILARLGLRSEAARGYASEILEIIPKPSAGDPVYLIEGEKKALALQAAIDCQYEAAMLRVFREYGIAGRKNYALAEMLLGGVSNAEVVGLSGVWQTRKGAEALRPDLDELVDFKGRDVCICFDRDLKSNRNVVFAMAMLNKGLKRAGAASVCAASPARPKILAQARDGECKGFDDTVGAVAKRILAGNKYLRMLKAYEISLKALRESFVPMRTDYSRDDLRLAYNGKHPDFGSDIYSLSVNLASCVRPRICR